MKIFHNFWWFLCYKMELLLVPGIMNAWNLFLACLYSMYRQVRDRIYLKLRRYELNGIVSSSSNDGQSGNALLPTGGYWCEIVCLTLC